MKRTGMIIALISLIFTIVVTSVGVTWTIGSTLADMEKMILTGQNSLDKRVSRIEIKLNIIE